MKKKTAKIFLIMSFAGACLYSYNVMSQEITESDILLEDVTMQEDPSQEVLTKEEPVPEDAVEQTIAEAGQDVSSENETSVDSRTETANAEPVFEPGSFPSLLFTYWELQSIEDARNSIGQTRPPTEEEAQQLANIPGSNNSMTEEPVPIDPGIRIINLSGITYKSSDRWTIWLNGERVTPESLPEQVIDLRVYKNYVEMKWFDEYKNQIIPIRLRAHQRFNIDSRVFLPG